MPVVDGKYCTVNFLKQYLIGTVVTPGAPGNPSVYQGVVSGTPDDNILSGAILGAEAMFEMVCGTGFDQQTYSLVQPINSFIDGNSWLHLYAVERGPITAVSAIQIRNKAGTVSGWQTLSWSVDDIIYPPHQATDTGPHADSWHVQVYPATFMLPTATGDLLARWSYTGGFLTIPTSLSMLIARYATWIYKMREAPIGRVTNLPLGSITVPMDVPPEIRRQMSLWSPVYS
jgi:hypothetical protein